MDCLRKDSQPIPQDKRVAMLTVICKIANIHNQTLNALQKIYGLQLRQVGCSKTGIETFNRLHDCVSYPTILSTLDAFAKETDDHLRNFSNSEVTHVGDNVDVRLKVRHELDSRSYHDLHMYNNMLYKARIQTDHLEDTPPAVPTNANSVDYSKFIPSQDDQTHLLSRLEPLIAKVWSHVNAINKHASDLSVIPPHQYSAEMRCRSEKV